MNQQVPWLDEVKWTTDGLVPVIAQEKGSQQVLMFAWMNREALRLTAETGRAVYWHHCFFRKLVNGNWETDQPVLKKPEEIYSHE